MGVGSLKQYLPGKRNLKTALTVGLCMVAGQLTPFSSPFFMALAGIITVQVSTMDSFKMGRARILGTVIGAIIGFVFALIGAGNPVLTALGIIVVIHICDRLHWHTSIQIATVVFMAIMVNVGEQTALTYSLNRLIDTAGGVAIALIVNYFILPYSNLPLIQEGLRKSTDYLEVLINAPVISVEDVEPLRKHLLALRDQLNLYEQEVAIKSNAKDLLPMLQLTFEHEWDAFEHLKQIYRLESAIQQRGCQGCNKAFAVCKLDCDELQSVLLYHQKQAHVHLNETYKALSQTQ